MCKMPLCFCVKMVFKRNWNMTNHIEELPAVCVSRSVISQISFCFFFLIKFQSFEHGIYFSIKTDFTVHSNIEHTVCCLTLSICPFGRDRHFTSTPVMPLDWILRGILCRSVCLYAHMSADFQPCLNCLSYTRYSTHIQYGYSMDQTLVDGMSVYHLWTFTLWPEITCQGHAVSQTHVVLLSLSDRDHFDGSCICRRTHRDQFFAVCLSVTHSVSACMNRWPVCS